MAIAREIPDGLWGEFRKTIHDQCQPRSQGLSSLLGTRWNLCKQNLPSESVKQTDNLDSLELKMAAFIKFSFVKFVTREENFQSGTQTLNLWKKRDEIEYQSSHGFDLTGMTNEMSYLKFAPQSTLVTTHAVHDTRNVPEMKLEFFLKKKAIQRLVISRDCSIFTAWLFFWLIPVWSKKPKAVSLSPVYTSNFYVATVYGNFYLPV